MGNLKVFQSLSRIIICFFYVGLAVSSSELRFFVTV